MDELTWKMAALGLRLDSAEKSDLINQTLLARITSQFDYKSLQNSYQNLIKFSSASVRPVTNLYYPSINSRFESRYRDLLDLGLSATNLEVMSLVNETLDELAGLLPEAAIFSEDGQKLNLLLRVPKPEKNVSSDRGGMPLASDSLRAKIWTFIKDGGSAATLALNLPQDVFYQEGRTTGRLSCRQVRPIIDSAAVGLVLNKFASPAELEPFNAGPDTVELSVGPEIVYSSKSGSTTYRYYNRNNESNVSSSSLPVQYLAENSGSSLARRITQLTGARNSAIGLSPFSRFEIKGLRSTVKTRESALKNALGEDIEIDELVLGFRTVVTSTNRNVAWAPACR